MLMEINIVAAEKIRETICCYLTQFRKQFDAIAVEGNKYCCCWNNLGKLFAAIWQNLEKDNLMLSLLREINIVAAEII